MIVIIVFLSLLFSAAPVSAIEFYIGDAQVVSNEITLTASISAAASNYYLQGVLRAVDSSKYFGETKNMRGDWIDYTSSPEKEYIAANFFLAESKESSWSAILSMRFKADDPNYKGPGNYELKVRRYTGGSSSSAGESNTLLIPLSIALPVPSPSPIPTPSPSVSPSPESHPSPVISPSPIPLPRPPTPSPSPIGSVEPGRVGTVAAAAVDLSSFGLTTPTASASPSATPELKLNETRLRVVLSIGIGLILISLAGILGYRRYLVAV